MSVELAVAALFVVLGAPFALVAGIRGWGVAAWAPLLGTFAYLAIGELVVVAGAPTGPAVVLGCAAALALAGLIWVRADLARAALPIGASLAGALAVTAAAYWAGLAKWTADSLVYLNVGGLLADNTYRDVPSAQIADERLIGVGLLHEPAALTDAVALQGVTPVLALAALGVAVWFLATGAHERVPRRWILIASLAIVAVAVTANRMVFTAFYINGHVIVGAAVLVIAGTGWLVAAGRAPARLAWVAALVLPGAVVTRPDAAVALGLVVSFVVLEPRLARGARATLLGTLGLATAAWYAFACAIHLSIGNAIPVADSLQFVAGVALVALAAVARARELDATVCRRLALGLVAATWLAAFVAAIFAPWVALRSVYATVVNLAYAGGWAPTLPLLFMVAVACAVVWSLPEVAVLQRVVATFPPLALVFAVVRDGAYRVGPGDSLNRSWAHVVPVLLLLVSATVLLGRLRSAEEIRAWRSTVPQRLRRSAPH